MESILTSIKKLLGITEEYDHFDQDIIMHINSVFMVLTQIGVGPSEGFSITDKSATWADFIRNNPKIKAEWLQSYVYMKVKLMFDPPLGSVVMESMNKLIGELEWRLYMAAESDELTVGGDDHLLVEWEDE